MTITTILAFAAIAFLLRVIFRGAGRGWALMMVSILAIYYLQPALPIRNLDFWLPTATLVLVICSWTLTAVPEEKSWKKSLPTMAALLGVVLLIALTRLFSLIGVLTPSRPPQFWQVGIAMAVGCLFFILLSLQRKPTAGLIVGGIFLLLGLLVVLKLPELNLLVSGWLNKLSGGAVVIARGLDIRWLGFSYIAFRLIHTLRDRQSGRLPAVTLQEYINYVIFFPAVSAGPIDRVERFIQDLRAPLPLNVEDFGEGGKRLVIGLFKKFAIADSLAIFALNATNTIQVKLTGWMWVLLYAYALQIYFDFSGYTDIAIGLGRWLGFRLPENFERPYLKPNLTLFWNSWHITLTQWFRAYFFNPVARWLRSVKRPIKPWVIIFLAQSATMLLIGLWHGITWNFVLWGAWHALGLFVHNRWSEWLKPHNAWFDRQPRLKSTLSVVGMIATFNYVALGWVWFALPSVQSSLTVFAKLLGVR